VAIEALKDGNVCNRMCVVSEGERALQYLTARHPYTQAARPDLVLLDLNLPRKDGRGVLAAIRADPMLQSLPVAVLTASADEQDVLANHRLQATYYMVKPVDATQLLDVVASVAHFWIRVDRLHAISVDVKPAASA
jgi:chemotaxis family two-component system response regulator Rcp1